MDDEIPNRVYGDPLARWFVTEAYRITDTGQLIGAAGEQLVAAGIPLYRLAYFQLTLHPEFAGKAYTWRRGHGVKVSEATHGLMERSEYLDNPLPPVFEQRRTVRVRLEAVEPQAPLLKQLKQDGATDYVALPLLFTTGHVDALSVVSDRPVLGSQCRSASTQVDSSSSPARTTVPPRASAARSSPVTAG